MNTKQNVSVEEITGAEAVGSCPLSPASFLLTPPAEPVVFVIYFSGVDPRFAEILGRWFEFYYASGCPWPVRVLTDLETNLHPIGHIIPRWGAHRFDASEYAGVMRHGNAFDRKSAIICAALPRLPACSVVVDSDAFFLRDPSARLMEFSTLPFAMAEDAGGRWIGLADGTIREQSSSVMVFGHAAEWSGVQGLASGAEIPETQDARPETPQRAALCAEYVKAWKELAKTPNQSSLEVDIREQRAWSVVKHRTGAPLLPRECNDSRFWKGPSATTLIYHAHGKEKFGPAVSR